jgi:phosphotriesterase-related protein
MEGQDALLQLSILEDAGADPGRVVIGHLDCLDDVSVHSEIARRGAFVGFDRIGICRYQSDERRIDMLIALLDAGYQDRILLSSDVAHVSRLRSSGSDGYSYVLRSFRARFAKAPVPASVWESLLTENPRQLLAFDASSAPNSWR